MRIEEIARTIPAEVAQRFMVETMVILGSSLDWSADQLEDIEYRLSCAVVDSPGLLVPRFSAQSYEDVDFWERVQR